MSFITPVKTQHVTRPSIRELGDDLLTLSPVQLGVTLMAPFVFFVSYFLFAFNGYWIPAVLCTMALSFASYGSTSHDLVHENLGINKTLNTILLSLIEWMCFRSGHAYKLSHLYHHKRYPHDDDVEGAAARMTLVRTLLEGVIFQFKIYTWALLKRRDHHYHKLVVIEGIAVIASVAWCVYSISFTYVFIAYMLLMIAGSWIIPLVTSYAVHDPSAPNELTQTRLFRGRFFSMVAFDHLYHLEHHLYPSVPHKNWPKLAHRLDNYFHDQGIRPIELKLQK